MKTSLFQALSLVFSVTLVPKNTLNELRSKVQKCVPLRKKPRIEINQSHRYLTEAVLYREPMRSFFASTADFFLQL